MNKLLFSIVMVSLLVGCAATPQSTTSTTYTSPAVSRTTYVHPVDSQTTVTRTNY